MGKGRKIVAWLFVFGGAGYVGYKYYKRWEKHEVLVEVTEVLHLPETNSELFTDLSVPLEGTIRVKCNLRWCCTFRLAMRGIGTNGMTGSMSPARAGSLRGNSVQQYGSMGGTGTGSGPQWDSVETNMIVDPLIFEQLGSLEFTPALYGDYLVAKYQAWPHEQYTCASSVKHCWLYPGGSPNTYQITLELHIHETVGEVAVSFILEKGSEVLSADTNKVGSWRRIHPRSTEYMWDVGNFAFDRGLTQSRGPMLGEPTLTGTVNPRGNNNNSNSPQHKTSIIILPFSVVFVAPSSHTGSSSSGGGGSINSFSAGGGGDSGPVMPGVTLTYTTTHSASGIQVDRMKVVKGEGPKPFRAAYHRTLHSQPIEVVPQL